MDESNQRLRHPRDGSEISLLQAQLWMELGAGLAGILRRVRSAMSSSAEEASDGTTRSAQAGEDKSSDREAA